LCAKQTASLQHHNNGQEKKIQNQNKTFKQQRAYTSRERKDHTKLFFFTRGILNSLEVGVLYR
jgi:hypothetical protein